MSDVLLLLVHLLQLHQLLHAQRQLLLNFDEVLKHLSAALRCCNYGNNQVCAGNQFITTVLQLFTSFDAYNAWLATTTATAEAVLLYVTKQLNVVDILMLIIMFHCLAESEFHRAVPNSSDTMYLTHLSLSTTKQGRTMSC